MRDADANYGMLTPRGLLVGEMLLLLAGSQAREAIVVSDYVKRDNRDSDNLEADLQQNDPGFPQ